MSSVIRYTNFMFPPKKQLRSVKCNSQLCTSLHTIRQCPCTLNATTLSDMYVTGDLPSPYPPTHFLSPFSGKSETAEQSRSPESAPFWLQSTSVYILAVKHASCSQDCASERCLTIYLLFQWKANAHINTHKHSVQCNTQNYDQLSARQGKKNKKLVKASPQ